VRSYEAKLDMRGMDRCASAFAKASTRANRRLASGFAQANFVVLPEEHAFDFLKFCVKTRKQCPVLEVTEAGSPEPVVTAPGRTRTDVPEIPGLRTRGDGGGAGGHPAPLAGRPGGVPASTFEAALMVAGLRIAHVEQGRNVPMYVTGRESPPVPSGPMVVSMRPYRAEEIPLVVRASGRYPAMHGAPAHRGPRGFGDKWT
jgi:uncharacterized protein YcsI (UPF0317 family)